MKSPVDLFFLMARPGTELAGTVERGYYPTKSPSYATLRQSVRQTPILQWRIDNNCSCPCAESRFPARSFLFDIITAMNSIKNTRASNIPSPIRAILFDCDGTLIDSEEPGLDVLHELARGEGLGLTREQADAQFRGVRMAECIAWIATQLAEKPPSFETDFMSRLRAATELRFRSGLSALPGAHELLSRLSIPFCVASNGPREKLELTLKLTGLRPLLGERIFSAYEVGSYKPDPGLFLHAASALGIPPEHCAVVEDSLPGISAGLAAGMRVFALRERTSLPADIAERVTCIGSLAELGLRFFDHGGALDFSSPRRSGH